MPSDGNSKAADPRQSVSKLPEPVAAIDESDALYRETLLYMRIQLGSDAKMNETILFMSKIIKNILDNPGDDKFCKLKMSNQKMKDLIFSNEQANFILELVGFEEMQICPKNSVKPEPYFVLNGLRCDKNDMKHLCGIFDDLVKKGNMTPLTSRIRYQPASEPKLAAAASTPASTQVPINYKKSKEL